MAKATIGGIEIAYTDAGEGMPLVLIHGYPLNRTMWEAQVRALSSEARCIAIDLRGHGESQAPFWLTSVDTYADDVRGLLDHLGIDRAVICGFSMGGYVALAFYRNHERRCRGLVLADTRAQPDSPEAKQARFQAALTAQTRGASAIAEAMLPRLLTQKSVESRPDLVERVRAMIQTTPVQGIAGDLMAMAERPDSVPLLPSVNVMTLVIVGDADALTPPADARLMADGIPGARLDVIHGAAHLANMEQPEIFNLAVSDFLRSLA